MLVTLGILSIFQLVFLPGLIVSRLVKVRGTGNIILISLALSPIINYLFVVIATTLGLYTQLGTLIFFGVELLLIFYFYLPILKKNPGQIRDAQTPRSFFREYLNTIKNPGWVGLILKGVLVMAFLASVFCILYYGILYGPRITSVFTAWDAVVSWDRWAVDWAHNHFPGSTWHYPQLIPANWSLTYQFMNDARIKFFAKGYMGWMEIFILLIPFILGVNKRQVGYFIGVVITAGLQLFMGSRGNGYVDSSVAFFALSSVACLIIAQQEPDHAEPKYVYLGAVIAAGAAITKQAGLWAAVAYPFLMFFSFKRENRKSLYRYLPGIIGIYALIIFPWYGYKEYQVSIGRDGSEIMSTTTLATQGRSLFQRIGHSLGLIQTKLSYRMIPGEWVMILLGLLMLIACGDGFFLPLFGWFIVPFYLIWAIYFSYDTRNFNMVVPLVGLTAGIGAQKVIEWMEKIKSRPLSKSLPFANQPKRSHRFQGFNKPFISFKIGYLVIPVLAIFLLPLIYTNADMVNTSVAMQKEMGNSQVNDNIYAYQAQYGLQGKILTDYQYLGFLPGLQDNYQWADSSDPTSFIEQVNEPQVRYALLNTEWISPEVANYVRQNIISGSMKTIFEEGPYWFVASCAGPCN
jgi:hypothetical protein